ncbi:low-complexity protein [Leptolyngbya sp. 'hensonii']|uniref:pentapeptide repeat-containing protein n=1 Tax=Leptolyngbya sp. 'hensonii' TaxID=1922337 RepID=UPI00094FAF25|nr:pentapeptide repeat-containing protein [Leptolyngbya sp. 'hensonii']OLP19592.1 low-complexity protein [Leptolyngbya sp. 'hensonii']
MLILRFLCFCLAIILLCLPIQPAWATIAQPALSPLTLEILQTRIKSPVQSDGIRTIDLQRFTIDLRPENGTFRDEFYRLLQNQLQRSNPPIGLDLSYSQILGEFTGSQLGLRTPLYGPAQLPVLTPTEQAQLQRDRRRLSQLSQLSRSLLTAPNLGAPAPASLQMSVFRGPLKLLQTRLSGPVNFANTFFLNRVEAQGATFTQEADWSQTRFSQLVSFAGATFGREVRFRNSIFFAKARFNQTQFQAGASFYGSEFQATAGFNQALFQQVANFSRTRWQGNADFAQVHWQEEVQFTKSKFEQALFLTEATIGRSMTFRETQFNAPINLRGAALLGQADFSDTGFARSAYLNVPGLKFDSNQSRLLGTPGQIGRLISVPTLQGNETLLRELVRNFRELEQITDANQVEYTTERILLRELGQKIVGTNINAASIRQLLQAGFTPLQAEGIVQRRIDRPFRSLTDLLAMDGIDLSTYVRVRDRVVPGEPLSPTGQLLSGLQWIGLNLLLLLSLYGTSSWLVLGVGIVTIAFFGVMLWLVDRFRRLRPQPIVPRLDETLWVLSSFALLTLLGMTAIFRTADRPWWTVGCLSVVAIPIPLLLIGLIYQRGRYHDLMTVSYFVEEGSLRQLRLLIGRLPVIPRFPLFRERYLPILWDRRWNWLNYFDFSLNNLLKLGFNDLRVRDEHLPGLIATLVWYQWSLGILYISLLLWTLSRTIPGLNLLIYFR